METKFTTEQILSAVQSEATAYGRCCDCYQDAGGAFCCHDCGQKTMAMLNGVQRVLGVGTKDGKPVPKMEQAEAIKAAILRRAAPDMFEALLEARDAFEHWSREYEGMTDEQVKADPLVRKIDNALAKARAQ